MDTKSFKYKFCLLKAYFEKGYGFLSYPKYVLFLIGLGDVISSGGNYKNVMFIGAGIAVLCFIIGAIWYNFGLVEAETEVGNQFNPFVKEMRELSGCVVSKKI